MAGSIPIIMDEPSVERERLVRRFFEVPAQHARRANAAVRPLHQLRLRLL